MKKTAIACITPGRVSKRGRINEGCMTVLTSKIFRAGASGYFTYCENRLKTTVDEDGNARTQVCPETPTKEGLAVFLSKVAGKFIGTHEIAAWKRGEGHAQNDPELADAVKEAHQEIEAATMRRILDSRTPAGAIFYAKAALGYRDVQTVEQSGPDGGPIQTQNKIIFEFRDTTFKGDLDEPEQPDEGTERKPTDSECVERR